MILDPSTLLAATAMTYALGGLLVYAGRDIYNSRGAEWRWLGGSLLLSMLLFLLGHPDVGSLSAAWLLLLPLGHELLQDSVARQLDLRRPFWCHRYSHLASAVLLLLAKASGQPAWLLFTVLLLLIGFQAGMAWLLLCKPRKRSHAAMLLSLSGMVFSTYLLWLSGKVLLSDGIASHDEGPLMLLLLANALVMQLSIVQIQRDQQYHQLSRLAALDPLTGIFNRRTFFNLAQRQMSIHIRHQRALCLLVIDLDHFKKLNDTYGHACGDQALRAVADCLCDIVRQGDLFARIGGEEFCLLLPETSLEGGQLVAGKLLEAINAIPAANVQNALPLTASIGVASMIPAHPGDWQQLFDRADSCLYQAKKQGRNQVIAAGAPN